MIRPVNVIIILCTMTILLSGCAQTQKAVTTEPDNTAVAANSVKSDGELTIIIQESPPFSFTKDGQLTGFVTEIVEDLKKRQNISQELTVLPFKRGFELVSNEPMTVLCGMTRTPERESKFKWVGPVAQVTTGFYALNDSKLSISNIEDAKKIEKIGVTLGYYTEQMLLKEDFTNYESAATPEGMLDKLLFGRSDVILSDNIAINGLLKSKADPSIKLKMIYKVETKKSYLAFSLSTPDEIVKSWQDALNDAYSDGKVQSIYNKWLPNEPLPERERIE